MLLRIALLLLWSTAAPLPARSDNPVVVENRYNLVSAFLFNFLMFTEWPEAAATNGFVIGVLGSDPFGPAAATVASKKVDGRPVAFRYFDRVEDIGPVHILFIPRARDADGAAACRRVRGSGVLTVGEGESFTRQGGIIRFFEQEAGPGGAAVLRVEINKQVADEEGIRFRSKLMRLAERVNYPYPEGP